jgi:D-proline reductase (dithiol) PrdB
MPTDLKQLMTDLADSGRGRTPLSRLNFLRQVTNEDELATLVADLLVKTAEGKHTGDWSELIRFIEELEDRTLARVAAEAAFPDLGETPWTPFEKPLSQARVALMTSGGLYRRGQEAFVLTNDPTYRTIPRTTQQDEILVAHRGYDVAGPLQDMNCLLPLRRMEELEAETFIGSLAPTNYSFNGSVPDTSALQEWPHEVAQQLRAEQVDAVMLTPA